MNLKEKILSLKFSKHRIGRYTYYLIQKSTIPLRLITDKKYRLWILKSYFHNKKSYQLSTFTKKYRYPTLFKETANYLQNVSNPTILSFGCSTGEEVISIGELIPNAQIIGVDIDNRCIKECIKNNNNTNHHYYNSLSEEFIKLTDFDAIFCMAVFQRTENRNRNNHIAKGFTFELFENEIKNLDNKLVIGGLLIIDHADFNFQETSISKKYHPLLFEKNQILRNRPIFNNKNEKVNDHHSNYRVFVKQK